MGEVDEIKSIEEIRNETKWENIDDKACEEAIRLMSERVEDTSGWLAIALVIFSIWNPLIGIFAAILFGGLYIVHLYIPTGMDYMEFKELYKMIPYVVTLFVLVLTSMRNKKENQPPASLGLSFFREER